MTLIKRTIKFKKIFKTKNIIQDIGTDLIICDDCKTEYNQKISATIARRKGKIADGNDYCKECTQKKVIQKLVIFGTASLSNLSSEERKKICSNAGKKGASSPNAGRFSTENWNKKTKEEQNLQVKKANTGLTKKLEDPVWAATHYAKIFKQTGIGYVSKGHEKLHELIEIYDFISHYQISKMQVDECNPELKIVIEYNGDYWHCNPRIWKSDDYNKSIKMFAGEKWKKTLIDIKI